MKLLPIVPIFLAFNKLQAQEQEAGAETERNCGHVNDEHYDECQFLLDEYNARVEECQDAKSCAKGVRLAERNFDRYFSLENYDVERVSRYIEKKYGNSGDSGTGDNEKKNKKERPEKPAKAPKSPKVTCSDLESAEDQETCATLLADIEDLKGKCSNKSQYNRSGCDDLKIKRKELALLVGLREEKPKREKGKKERQEKPSNEDKEAKKQLVLDCKAEKAGDETKAGSCDQLKANKGKTPKGDRPEKERPNKKERPDKADRPKKERPAKEDRPKKERPAKEDGPVKEDRPAKEDRPKKERPAKEDRPKKERPPKDNSKKEERNQLAIDCKAEKQGDTSKIGSCEQLQALKEAASPRSTEHFDLDGLVM